VTVTFGLLNARIVEISENLIVAEVPMRGNQLKIDHI
jgi:hypothetical protein